MSKALIFAERNFKENLRSPISWAFGLALPVGLFAIMQTIVKSIGDAAAQVPMFAVGRFTGGAVLFGASFLSLFTAMLVSGDRSQSFLARLMTSPMRARDYIIGYLLGVLPIAAAQVVITFAAALCFGLTPTVNILPAAVFSMIGAVMFAAIGMMLGSLLSAKNAPPLCSVVVQVAALLSGMWFDLDMIGGGFAVFCRVFPFAHLYDMIRYTLSGDYGNVWLPFIIVAAYTAVFSVCAVLCFKRRMRA